MDEVILVDDGSSDNTIAIVREFLPSVKILAQKNSGVSSARNAGLKLVSNELLIFLDQDDFLLKGGVEKLVKAFNENSGPDMVYSDYLQVDESGTPQAEISQPDLGNVPLDRLLLVNCSATVCCLFRKETLLSLEGFDPEIMGCEDWDLYIRIAAANKKIYHLKDLCYAFRRHPHSNSKRFKLMWKAFRQLERKHHTLTTRHMDKSAETRRRDKFLNDNLRFLYGQWDEQSHWLKRRLNRSLHFFKLLFFDQGLVRDLVRRALFRKLIK